MRYEVITLDCTQDILPAVKVNFGKRKNTINSNIILLL